TVGGRGSRIRRAVLLTTTEVQRSYRDQHQGCELRAMSFQHFLSPVTRLILTVGFTSRLTTKEIATSVNARSEIQDGSFQCYACLFASTKRELFVRDFCVVHP